MNLHIAPDNIYVNRFYDNLKELNLLDKNRIVVRTNSNALKAVKRDVPFARLYSSHFSSLVGDTLQYDKVYIHYFTPLLYRWVATHQFKELNWMVWGGDLYNLPGIDHFCYEPLTLNRYIKRTWSWQTIVYDWKVFLTQSVFKRKAYRKVKNILTWMNQEFQFAQEHLPIQAKSQFFFYENSISYDVLKTAPREENKKPILIIGNSGSATNNHLDVIDFLETNRIEADLIIPVSYGEKQYIDLVRKEFKYSHGKVDFLDRYMPFEEYLNLLMSADALVMNTARPQGYGNILMMLYMEKLVFFNERNTSLPDLTAFGIQWFKLSDIKQIGELKTSNKEKISQFLSHEQLLKSYQSLFS